MATAIRVERLSKEYQLGVLNRATLYAEMQSWWARVRGKEDPNSQVEPGNAAHAVGGRFRALNDVSFEIQQGEAVGIIGRNGAGKSTLLKILSKITAPTSGRVLIKGRVASLLEVGTGFHLELTGRENVYLNGAILGMTRRDIAAKFDEIAAFSGVEAFLDTPVKRYSSGMKVRLAFAVAAHLEPEILIIDEVLAVGDAAFQKKCLNKMQDVGKGGRTVLFVSHNMPAVTRLCPRTVLLADGAVERDGPSPEVVHLYLQTAGGVAGSASREWADPATAPGDAVARLRAVQVQDRSGKIRSTVKIREAVALRMEFDVLAEGRVLVPNVHLYNEDGTCIFVAGDLHSEWRGRPRMPGRYLSTAWIPGDLLAEGLVVVHVALSELRPVLVHFHERDAVAFQVVDSLDGDSARGDFAGTLPGVVRPLLEWETEYRASTPA